MKPNAAPELKIRDKIYARYMHMVQWLGSGINVNVKVTQEPGAMQRGDIFLFNHFTRLETLLPPYLIYRETGAKCRSVAHHDLFEVNQRLAQTLRQAGGVPNNMPGLLPFLAREILAGRKVIIFPEGSMVKDRHVMDAQGNVSIYSPDHKVFRKHHRGAAVLALTLDLIKYHLNQVLGSGDVAAINAWCEDLGLTPDKLRVAVEKPTAIVPGNITYYPIRTGDNFLVRGMGNLFPRAPQQAFEEVLIESNMLFRPTDMDVHFNAPMVAMRNLQWADKILLDKALQDVQKVEDFFALHNAVEGWSGYYVKKFLDAEIDRLREDYARNIYKSTTININHVVSALVLSLAEQGRMEVEASQFHKAMYVALKALQKTPEVNLHCSLTRPVNYQGLLGGESAGFKGFIHACSKAKLLKRVGNVYRLSYRLFDVHDLHEIRLENPVRMHANEAAPVVQVRREVEKAFAQTARVSEQKIAELLLDDELREYAGQRYRFGKRAPQTLVNVEDPANGEPYLLLPVEKAKTGILLAHGFNASPGELKGFSRAMQAQGYAVMGIRLPGHGTSYLDMENRTYAEWQGALSRGHQILSAYAEKIVVVGFSTGAALALQMGVNAPANVLGVASISAPMFVQDKNIRWLPLVSRMNDVFHYIPGLKNVLRYYGFETPQPQSNYSIMPVGALNQLRLLIRQVAYSLGYVKVPVLVVQGKADEIVQPSSAAYIFKHLGSAQKQLCWVENGAHAILGPNSGGTWGLVSSFVSRLEKGEAIG